MQIRYRRPALWLAVLWALVVGARPLAAEEAIPGDRRLPRNVVAFMSLRNVNDFREQWNQSLVGRMIQDEAMADFREAAARLLGETSTTLQESLGLKLDDLLQIPQGELAAAAFVGKAGDLQVALLLDFGDKEESIRTLVEKLNESAESQGMKRSEEEYEDTKLVIHRASNEEGGAGGESVAHAIKGSFLILGNGAAALKAVLSRWDGTHDDTFAEVSAYRYIAERCRDEHQDASPLLTWFLDPISLVKAFAASQPELAQQSSMVLGMLPFVGADKFKGLGGTFDMSRGDFDMVSRTLIYLEPPARGVINMLQFDEVGATPPAWVSADSSSYFSLNWNVLKAYSAAEAMVDSFMGAGTFARQIQSFADNEQFGGLHLKKDLIDLLSGKLHVVGVKADGDDDELDEDYLVAIEVKNTASAKALLRKISQIPGIPVKEREFQGETLYEFESQDDDGPSMGLVVAENCFVYSQNVKLVERMLRGAEGREPLAGSPLFQRVASRFPDKVTSVSFSREDNPLAALEGLLNLPIPQLMMLNLSEIGQKLPEPELLKKYASTSGSYMEPDKNGLKITSFSLKASSD